MGNSDFDGLQRRWDRVHTYLWLAGDEGLEAIIFIIVLGFTV